MRNGRNGYKWEDGKKGRDKAPARRRLRHREKAGFTRATTEPDVPETSPDADSDPGRS